MTSGMHVGSSRIKTVAAVESDPSAAASFEATFGHGIMYNGTVAEWLREGISESFDLVVGGPPCQGFSTLGKQDAEDERNGLWRQYAETLVRVQPKYFVVENVSAFARSSQFRQFVAETSPGGLLEDYAFQHRILNAADYGAPQARKRAVVIGHHRDLDFPGFPERTHGPGTSKSHATVETALRPVPLLPDKDAVLGTKFYTHANMQLPGSFSPREMHWSRTYTELSLRRFATIPPGGNRHDLPEELMAPCWVGHKSGSGDVMGRLRLERPSVTIRTEFFKPEKGRYLHPTENRSISHYEAALLQGFTEDHRFVGSKTAIARQIGNAVPIALGAAIGRSIAGRL